MCIFISDAASHTSELNANLSREPPETSSSSSAQSVDRYTDSSSYPSLYHTVSVPSSQCVTTSNNMSSQEAESYHSYTLTYTLLTLGTSSLKADTLNAYNNACE